MSSTPAQIAEFLTKLDSDDNFRNTLKNNSDPTAILAQYGIEVELSEILPPAERTLPDKGEIEDNWNTYKEQMFPGNEFSSNDHNLKIDAGS